MSRDEWTSIDYQESTGNFLRGGIPLSYEVARYFWNQGGDLVEWTESAQTAMLDIDDRISERELAHWDRHRNY